VTDADHALAEAIRGAQRASEQPANER